MGCVQVSLGLDTPPRPPLPPPPPRPPPLPSGSYSRVGNQWVAPSHTYVYFEQVDGWACTSCGAPAIYRTMRALTSWCSDPPSKKGTDPPQVCIQARLPAPRLFFKPRSTMDVGVANNGQIEK